MKVIGLVLSLLLTACTSGCVGAPRAFLGGTGREGREVVTKTTYRLEIFCKIGPFAALSSYGSAVAISRRRLLTAYHVVNCPGTIGILVTAPDGRKRRAKPELNLPDADLARIVLIDSEPDNFRWAPTLCVPPEPGDQTLMFTGQQAGNFFFKIGYVSVIKPGEIWTSAHVVRGNSGSGVFDERGCLLGITSSANWDSSGEFAGLAIPPSAYKIVLSGLDG